MQIQLGIYFKNYLVNPLINHLSLKEKTATYVASIALTAIGITFLYMAYRSAKYFFNKRLTIKTALVKADPNNQPGLLSPNHQRYIRTLEIKVKEIEDEIEKLDFDVATKTDISKVIKGIEFRAKETFPTGRPIVAQEIYTTSLIELQSVKESCETMLKGEKLQFSAIEGLSSARIFIEKCGEILTPAELLEFEKLIKGKPLNKIFLQSMPGTLLHFLALKGKPLQLVDILAKQDMDFNTRNRYGFSAIMWAIVNDNNNMVMQILQSAPLAKLNLDIQEQRVETTPEVYSPKHNTALHLLIAKGSDKKNTDREDTICNQFIVEQIINRKANVNLANIDGNTPMHIAFLRRDTNMIKCLLSAGGQLDLINSDGKTPVQLLDLSYAEASQKIKATVPHVKFYLIQKEFEDNLKPILEHLALSGK